MHLPSGVIIRTGSPPTPDGYGGWTSTGLQIPARLLITKRPAVRVEGPDVHLERQFGYQVISATELMPGDEVVSDLEPGRIYNIVSSAKVRIGCKSYWLGIAQEHHSREE